ncbi:Hypothetical protein PBC10988_32700 [Planctomycetales bacterium 10988]|nr:Hypothetical protein PBC10988_32700 [Planctomycetales bacterium 10988]
MNTWWQRQLGSWFGLEEIAEIRDIDFFFAASWTHANPYILGGCGVAILAMVILLYRLQRLSFQSWRSWILTGTRCLLVGFLIFLFAEPTLRMTTVIDPRPWLWVLLDGSDSMNLPLQEVTDANPEAETTTVLTRRDAVVEKISNGPKSLLEEWETSYRLRFFRFGGADELRSYEPETEETPLKEWHSFWTCESDVTALGEALQELETRPGLTQVAGVVVISDFNQNSGVDPQQVVEQPLQDSPSGRKLPLFTVGIGPASATDLAIELKVDPVLKKAEKAEIEVLVRQEGLQGKNASLRLSLQAIEDPLEEETGLDDETSTETILPSVPLPSDAPQMLVEQVVALDASEKSISIPFIPEQTGTFRLLAELEQHPQETVTRNNLAQREVRIRDDFLHVMFVAQEPTWEWRFVKEVFHRDRLVGQRGFRTYLRSADREVRQQNPMFLPALTPNRSNFFTNDVIILGDLRVAKMSARFGEMTKEFVESFGGGLILLAGPNAGWGELVDTPLEDLLPILPDKESRLKDGPPFPLRLSFHGLKTSFMQLGSGEEENQQAWENMGPLPWYQPVRQLHPLAISLAEHPADRCEDGTTPQPLIAMRRVGRGTVVTFAFDEMWRLRRLYGEKYYRQFWGQLLYYLGQRRDLGQQKRFVFQVDRDPPSYRTGEIVTLTLEGYDENFHALQQEMLPNAEGLAAEHWKPEALRLGEPESFSLPWRRPGLFEARFLVEEPGNHRFRVKDPITEEWSAITMTVERRSLERREPVRNQQLQYTLAQMTGGRAYELRELDRLLSDLPQNTPPETLIVVRPLWNSSMALSLGMFLMLSEWLLRKRGDLP